MNTLHTMKKSVAILLVATMVLAHGTPAYAIMPDKPSIEMPDKPSIGNDGPSIETPDKPEIDTPDKPEIGIDEPEKPKVKKPKKPNVENTPEPTPTDTQNTEESNTQDQSNTNDDSTDVGGNAGGTTDESNNSPETRDTNQGNTGESDSSNTGSDSGAQQNNNVGDTAIQTGDANNDVAATTTANTNAANGASVSDPDASSTIAGNTNNDNSTTIVDNQSSTTTQTNSATVVNNVEQDTNTGNNQANRNVGDVSIETGDANTSATLLTNVNTNIDGVMVSEFNIADDHLGDYVLDFDTNCISGCGGGSALAETTGNTNNDNVTTLSYDTNDATFQQNDADIANNMTLTSDSGNNTATRNALGDVGIVTGDANVSANVINMANNNIAGEVIMGTVNIYGDLIGDIIFPEELYNSAIASTTGNTNNDNTTNIDTTVTDTTTQTNDATIINNISANTNTGDNDVSRNAGGNNSIETGSSTIDSQTTNIANNNITGNWFLVLVNDAGNWVGQIFGSDSDGNVASNPQAEYNFDENGNIVVDTSDNANVGDNNTDVTNTTTNTLTQENTATIENNIELNANTGDNTAIRNAGGDVSVETGDANIMANIVNFVNNNIAENGRLFVTTVNVFGSWNGDFVMPWAKKEDTQVANANNTHVDESTNTNDQSERAIGGTSSTSSNDSASNDTTTSETSDDTTTEENTPTIFSGVVASRSVTKPVQRWYDSAGSSAHTNEEDDTELIAMAGISGSDYGTVQSASTQKTININLAWGILLLPIIGIAYAGKRLLRKHA